MHIHDTRGCLQLTPLFKRSFPESGHRPLKKHLQKINLAFLSDIEYIIFIVSLTHVYRIV